MTRRHAEREDFRVDVSADGWRMEDELDAAMGGMRIVAIGAVCNLVAAGVLVALVISALSS